MTHGKMNLRIGRGGQRGAQRRLGAMCLCLLGGLFAIPMLSSNRAAHADDPPAPFSVIATINVDTHPFGLTASPDGQTIWVANSGGLLDNSNTVTIIDVSTLTEDPDKITVGLFPEDIAFTSDGAQAFVTNSTDGTVSVIDASMRSVTSTISLAPVPLQFPFGIAVSGNDRKVFVTSGAAEFDGSDLNIAVLGRHPNGHVSLSGGIELPGLTGRPVLRGVANALLVPVSAAETGEAKLVSIGVGSESIRREVTLAGSTGFPNDMAVTPDGRFAYVSIYDFSGGTGGVWVVDLLHFQTVTVINTGDPHVFGIGITPDGRFVFATNLAQNTVSVIRTDTNTIVATVAVGQAPNDVAVTLDNSKAFVSNQNDTTVSVLTIPAP
jgi:YVTN family beta-propeller protein